MLEVEVYEQQNKLNKWAFNEDFNKLMRVQRPLYATQVAKSRSVQDENVSTWVRNLQLKATGELWNAWGWAVA